MQNTKPQILKISKIVQETPFVKTFYFEHKLNSRPGQFVMLWIPGIDQKPFSIAYDDKTFGLTIFKRGPLTEKLFSMNIGDRVGISGPFGTSFSIQPDTHYIMVAGGYGAAPLGCLAEKITLENNSPIDFIGGARDANNLLFEKRLKKINNLTLHITTDDGSRGHKGYSTDILEKILAETTNKQNILVVTCGPEMMEKKVLNLCNQYKINCEISIERYMKCGIGVCGQCAIDDLGICMCKHGPVVKKELANKIKEFGNYHRDKSGKIINF